ncbi:hydroxysqualene dehydroxylase [Nocardia takedensis]
MAESEVSRRSVMKGAAAGSIALAAASATSSGLVGLTRADAAVTKKKVAVLGGGIAGMTAAHELVERGYDVTIYERKAWGGKARSIDTPIAGTGGRKPLPGEHGFRFFPGYYYAVPDTMKRIPFPGNENGVLGNLTSALTLTAAQDAPDITLPFALDFDAIGLALHPQKVIKTLLGGLTWIPRLPVPDLLLLVRRLLVFFTSCDERRIGQWEKLSFKDFALMDQGPESYAVIISTVTRTLVAAKEHKASTRTICNQAEAFLLSIINRANPDAPFPDNVLNGPTNEQWIDPWVAYLTGKGVKMELGTSITKINVKDGRIGSASAKDASGADKTIEADWFVLAFSPEVVPKFITPEMLAIDPKLDNIRKLEVDWMNGIQFFLKSEDRIGAGHLGFIDSPWRLTGIQQNQFWKKKVKDGYGDGQVKDILSLCISDWDAPGQKIKKPAKKCSPQEVAEEVWDQVTRTQRGEPQLARLGNEDLHSWFLDPAIHWDPAAGSNTNEEPLLINTAGSWENRGVAKTAIPNLVLAGDYLQSEVDLATMEGACEGGRNAANAILEASGSDATKAKLWKHGTIREFEGARQLDRIRYRAGLKNVLDINQ